MSVLAYAKAILWPATIDNSSVETEREAFAAEQQTDASIRRPSALQDLDQENGDLANSGDQAQKPKQPASLELGDRGSEAMLLAAVDPGHSALDKLRSSGHAGGEQSIMPKSGNDNQPVGLRGLNDFSDTIRIAASSIDQAGGAQKTPQKSDEPVKDKPPTPEAEVNHAPVVGRRVELGQLTMNHTVVIALSALLANASDVDGDTLSVDSVTASSGDLVSNGDGTWTYTPVENDVTDVTFSYVVTDGTARVEQSAMLDLIPAVEALPPTDADNGLVGTLLDDVLVGTDAAEEFDGLAGNDVIYGGGGNDIIFAGDGDDVVLAGDGNDIVMAGAGDDVVFGGNGDDSLFGEVGNDLLVGGIGNDELFGGSGNDRLVGEQDHDIVIGGDGDDMIMATVLDGDDVYDGGAGTDTLNLSGTTANAMVDLELRTSHSSETGTDQITEIENVVGSSGDDHIVGNVGANVLTGGAGADVVSGGAGDDTIVATVGDSSDVYDGGIGTDTLDLAGTTADAVVNLELGSSSSAETGTDQIDQIENVVGSGGDDAITGDATANVLTGGVGADVVSGGAGNDTIVATVGDSNDVYDGGIGTDTLDFTSINSDVFVDLKSGTSHSDESGEDEFDDFENVNGGHGDDVIIADNHRNILTGGGGDDKFVFDTLDDIQSSDQGSDHIVDFHVGDKIDVSKIDADEDQEGKQEFKFSGKFDDTDAQPNKAGTLKYKYQQLDEGEETVIIGYTHDASEGDFQLHLSGHQEITKESFSGLG
ncbi:MAG: cadherin-like domain-containing protein [Hyphomicrobiaceae bacterium]|nr:cadherin-like domain-containing protein [Hyphomicrobiaceae bacterium]